MRGKEKKELIEVLPSGQRADEAAAVKVILGATLEDLAGVDKWNAEGKQPPAYAHIFVYEPAEALYLREAIGRHLDDPGVRVGLLNMIRIFPPDQAVPEPEFRGMHHLPASSLRTVVEQLYGLPVSVSYDLRQVSQALAGAAPPVKEPYKPKQGFERLFSSMLPIEITRDLRRGTGTVEAVRDDVRARLRATASVVEWLLNENAHAETPFLRLKKKPFRFQGEFDPLAASDLDVLQAYALLENRAGLLERITALAQPAKRRRDGLRCFAELRLREHRRVGYLHKITFDVPADSRQAELSPDSFGVVLTQDDPDSRRITRELRRQGWTVNRKKMQRLMREDNLLCLRRRRFVFTADSDHDLPVYPNRAREMVLTGIDQLWVADITYIRLETEFVYLAVILDAFSRKVIGWALDRTLEANAHQSPPLVGPDVLWPLDSHCGNEGPAYPGQLRSGHTTGCPKCHLRRATAAATAVNIIHGFGAHRDGKRNPAYESWRTMLR
jgi:hypothetical protein